MIRNLQTLNFSYLFNYTIAGEDLQKLRLATQMLAEYDVAKVAQYLLMDEEELNAQAIETELQNAKLSTMRLLISNVNIWIMVLAILIKSLFAPWLLMVRQTLKS